MEGDKSFFIVLAVGVFITISFLVFLLLWSAISPEIEESSGMVPEDTVQLSIVTVKGYSVWDGQGDSPRVTLQIKRGMDDLNLTGYQIISFDETQAHNLFVEKDGLIPAPGQTVTVSYELPPNFGKPHTLRVSPIIDGKLKSATYEMAFTLGSEIEDSVNDVPGEDLDYEFNRK